MAKFHVNLYLQSLNRAGSFDIMIPNDPREPISAQEREKRQAQRKTVILLHGYTGDSWNWVPDELAEKHNMAIVTLNGENGFYLDGPATGHAYQTMVGKELVDYLRLTFGLATKPENTFLLGFSMGGFGAIHTALAYPETFSKAGAMSNAMIIHHVAHMKPGSDNGVANYDYYYGCFGDLETVETREANPEVLVTKLVKEGKKIPELYLCCGLSDGLLEANREFDCFLTKQGVEHIYKESEGVHDFVFWNEYTEKILAWMSE